MLVLGRITGVYGVHGWVKVFSETTPRENILSYSPWYLGETGIPKTVAEGRRQGKLVIARLSGCEDRDQAAALIGLDIGIRRDQLPPPQADEIYWADLEGLAVETLEGVQLGQVDHLLSTAANDVLVVRGERERLLPFLWERVIREVDLERGLIRVDWDPEF